ncbi:MAG: hypothetical protein HN742_20930 [Lentisphaerae bacterium]|jgi:hypothetical protein|nr:hypothetical protein [Lentisphaerota bacterium]MBT4823217.1 hypothetical protein [Lentisphaerota bacterium]MBT5610727.1 hypothetical protein [Lentisphaerota bacterium]MBT7054296.1 hypothetical protein [Lentisphaerota bacterium]MBT7844357.1 hypothetical protein [Lentisphaerota bacterium]
MLDNSETLQGINQEELFCTMLDELPWSSFRAFVQANAQLLKFCTAGGHRLDAKRRKRVQKLVVREAKKAEFSASFCNGVFAAWYPIHADLHTALEEFFHSDEYKEYREKEELEEDVYVLSEEKFDGFFKIDDLQKWRVLLVFSPLKFTDEQAQKILDDSQGNTHLLDRISSFEERMDELQRENDRLTQENERLQKQTTQVSSESVDQKRATRELRVEVTTFETRMESVQTENKRLRSEVDSAEETIKKHKVEAKKKAKAEVTRLAKEVKRLEDQLGQWQAKYEEQRVETKGREERIAELETSVKDKEAEIEGLNERAAILECFPDLLLDKFDWPKVGSQMKLTPALKRQFNSLIKKLRYEEDRTLTIDGSITQFWTKLMGAEKTLVDSIAQSNSREVMTGDVPAYWLSLTDMFEDVRIGLEARCVLLKMLHEIFYQVIDMGDLEAPKLPPAMTKAKRS